MRKVAILLALVLGGQLFGAVGDMPAVAGVVVLQNRMPVKIEYLVNYGDGTQYKHHLTPTDIDSIRTPGPIAVTFHNGEEIKQFTAAPNAIYYFSLADNHVQFIHLGLPGVDMPDILNGRLGDAGAATPPIPTSAITAGKPVPPVAVPPGTVAPPTPLAAPAEPKTIVKVPVIILADGAEPRVRSVWEKKIRARFDAANEIFAKHCGVNFEIVGVRTWDADKHANVFTKALEDLEHKVNPAPARLAVGFTGRFEWTPGESHLGGTHGALVSHILIRESLANAAESEHLEILVHELGHFLGAVHSVDPFSVMRPKLGDHRSRLKSFRIGFDAMNTLAMSLVVEQMQNRNIMALGAVPFTSRAAMRGAYILLQESLPGDTAAPEAINMLGYVPEKAVPASAFSPPFIAGVKEVLAEINRAAAENHQRPAFITGLGDKQRRDGDQLTEFYVRRAAAAAAKLPPDVAPQALAAGLAIGFDDSTLIRTKPLLRVLSQRVEPPQQMMARLKIIDKPGLYSRNDLARHFFTASALAALSDPLEAESAMLWREVSLAHNGEEFSFPIYSADISGCIFGAILRTGTLTPTQLAERFPTFDYVLNPMPLRDEVRYAAFQSDYGGPSDERFLGVRANILRQVLLLPGFKGKIPGQP